MRAQQFSLVTGEKTPCDKLELEPGTIFASVFVSHASHVCTFVIKIRVQVKVNLTERSKIVSCRFLPFAPGLICNNRIRLVSFGAEWLCSKLRLNVVAEIRHNCRTILVAVAAFVNRVDCSQQKEHMV